MQGQGRGHDPGKGGGGEAISIDRSLCEESNKRVDSFDLNKDGKPDVWRMYAGQTLVCKQIDFDRDGRKDWIVAYDANGKTLYQQADFDYDGKYDMLAVFDVATGHATEVQRDTDFDGAFDVKEVYGAGGALTSVRRDRNGDNKPDQWEQYSDATVVAITYDDDYDGKVDRKEDAPGTTAPPVQPAPTPDPPEATPPAPAPAPKK
ncbi:MAG: hypothetical protein WKG01_33715 [Kofleriaceae bacterium]